MSSVTETVLIKEKVKKIAKTGNTAAIYIPREIKEYLRVGDAITFDVVIKGNNLEITIRKPLHNFGISDVQKMATECHFKTEYHKPVGYVTVLEAAKENVVIGCTHNHKDNMQPAYVTISKKFTDVDYRAYDHISSWATNLEDANVAVRVEGDLDAINMLKDPERYKLTQAKAFEKLKGSGKKIGLSVTCRFDGKNNAIKEVRECINKLSGLNP